MPPAGHPEGAGPASPSAPEEDYTATSSGNRGEDARRSGRAITTTIETGRSSARMARSLPWVMGGAPGVTRTPGTQFRKLLLYPPELRGRWTRHASGSF